MDAKKINLRQNPSSEKLLKIDPDTIPNLVPEKVLNEWMEGDDSPHYKIQQIEYPIIANGYNYTESFFESFISKINKAPIPGNKAGHEMSWGKRAPTDFILIGAKLDKKENGKGKVFLKNYIPPVGDSGSNEIFIKESKSNMIEFSLVSYTKDERIENPDGSVSYNVIESMFGERNDAVEYGAGSMEQKTNLEKDLDNKKNIGDSMDNLKDALNFLLTAKNNSAVDLKTIAEHLNLSDQLVTVEQKNAVATVKKLNSLTAGVEVVEFVETLISEKKANATINREAKMTEIFGAKIDEATKKENVIRTFADGMLGGKELTDDAIGDLKKNSIYLKLAADKADINSDQNTLGVIEKKNNTGTSAIGGKVEV